LATLLHQPALQVGGASVGRLSDAGLVVVEARKDVVVFKVVAGGHELLFEYDPVNSPMFSPAAGSTVVAFVGLDDGDVTLADYLAMHPPVFHAVEGGFLEGNQWLGPKTGQSLVLRSQCVRAWNWKG